MRLAVGVIVIVASGRCVALSSWIAAQMVIVSYSQRTLKVNKYTYMSELHQLSCFYKPESKDYVE